MMPLGESLVCETGDFVVVLGPREVDRFPQEFVVDHDANAWGSPYGGARVQHPRPTPDLLPEAEPGRARRPVALRDPRTGGHRPL